MPIHKDILRLRELVSGAVLVMLIASCRGDQPDSPTAPKPTETAVMTVTVIGSGTPVPNRSQAGAAILVERGEQHLLFDCGRGCSTRLAAYDPALLAEMDTVFLTHLHSDHVVGLPDLWLNGWTQGRQESFHVWGPEGTAAIFDGLRTAYAADITIRTAPNGPNSAASLNADVSVLPPEGGVVYNKDGLSVTAFPVSHAGMSAFGYRIDYSGRSVMISGDTTVTPNLVRYGEGADLILLEVASPAMVNYVRKTFPAPQADAIIGLHLTASQAADIMEEIQPELAVYYHTVASCETDPALLEATREVYEGPVRVSRDLMQIRLSPDMIETDYLDLNPADCS